MRYGWTEKDSPLPDFKLGDDVPSGEGFWIKRFRAWMRGDFKKSSLFVLFQADRNGKSPDLHIADLAFPLGQGVRLHIGQLQTPAERMIAFNCNRLLLIDRPRMSELMGPDKELGFMLELGEKGNMPGLRFGLFNGNGKASSRGEKPFMKTARIERKFGSLSIGFFGFDNESVSSSSYLSRFAAVNGDPYALKGFYSIGAGDERGWGSDCWFSRKRLDLRSGYTAMSISDSLSIRAPFHARGWYMEAGLFLKEREEGLQLVSGWQVFDPNDGARDIFDLTSATLGLNWFIDGYREVARVNYERRHEGPGGRYHGRFVFQYQLMFQ